MMMDDKAKDKSCLGTKYVFRSSKVMLPKIELNLGVLQSSKTTPTNGQRPVTNFFWAKPKKPHVPHALSADSVRYNPCQPPLPKKGLSSSRLAI